MKLEDIKVGETYLLPITVTAIEKSGWIETTTCNNNGYFHTPSEVKTLLPNGTKNTEPAPKYDPCRLFKKGDKARIVSYKGRCYDCDTSRHEGDIVTINVNESELEQEDLISVRVDDDFFYTDPAYLELVTPVEELEPYIVRHNEVHSAWSIYGPFNLSAVNYFYGERYPYTKDTAKKAAQAECNRLNAEYRKEQK